MTLNPTQFQSYCVVLSDTDTSIGAISPHPARNDHIHRLRHSNPIYAGLGSMDQLPGPYRVRFRISRCQRIKRKTIPVQSAGALGPGVKQPAESSMFVRWIHSR